MIYDEAIKTLCIILLFLTIATCINNIQIYSMNQRIEKLEKGKINDSK